MKFVFHPTLLRLYRFVLRKTSEGLAIILSPFPPDFLNDSVWFLFEELGIPWRRSHCNGYSFFSWPRGIHIDRESQRIFSGVWNLWLLFFLGSSFFSSIGLVMSGSPRITLSLFARSHLFVFRQALPLPLLGRWLPHIHKCLSLIKYLAHRQVTRCVSNVLQATIPIPSNYVK